MGVNKLTVLAVAMLLGVILMAANSEGRHLTRGAHHDEDHRDDDHIQRRPHPMGSQRGLSHKQGRVFPGAVAIKKLVLLKFKKIIPISLILLKSNNENEAELVPVYPTSEIPPNVQFIPTPNGISGHKDVQAIAIPSELHEQLQANGMANIENIESLLNQAEADNEDDDVVQSNAQPQFAVEEQLLNIKEDDENQLLDTPVKPTVNLRRMAVEDVSKHGLRSSTTVEEIPLYMYSNKNDYQQVQYPAVNKTARTRIYSTGRRHHQRS